MDTKQVVVIRNDLNMRKGKMVAMGCHASLGAILSKMDHDMKMDDIDKLVMTLKGEDALRAWLSGGFTKVCVSVDSEEELLDIYRQAEEAGLTRCLITDSGRTEFNGVKTLTALAIGPEYNAKIDIITGHLRLL